MTKFNEFVILTHNEKGEETILEISTGETRKKLEKRIKFGFVPECHGETKVLTLAEYLKTIK